jgi:hypothetical protein
MPAKKKERVKVGSVYLPLYPWTDPKTGKSYWRYSWKDSDGKWRYGTRAVKSEAQEAARAQARTIASGMLDLATLSAHDADLARQFLALKPTQEDLTKLKEWKAASGINLADTVREWHSHKLAEAHGIESPHLRNVRQWLEKFATAITGPAAHVTSSQIREYIESAHANAKSRRNARAHVVGLWKFARTHGLFESTEAEKVPGYKKDVGDVIDIWTPDEMKILLEVVPDEFLPWLVLATFSGLRSEEIAPKLRPRGQWANPAIPEYEKPPLKWDAIKRKQGIIDLPAATSKVRKRRLLPITPLLESWLAAMPPGKGAICPRLPAENVTGEIGAAVGGWRKNALRHSYGSYRAAVQKDLPALALEMGTSVGIIEKHYREAVSEEVAEKYWNLTPSEVLRKFQKKH